MFLAVSAIISHSASNKGSLHNVRINTNIHKQSTTQQEITIFTRVINILVRKIQLEEGSSVLIPVIA